MRVSVRVLILGAFIGAPIAGSQAGQYDGYSHAPQIVTLSHQIEEVSDEVQAPAMPASSQSARTSTAADDAAPRIFFPAARRFFRNLREETPATAQLPESIPAEQSVTPTAQFQVEPTPANDAYMPAPTLIPPIPGTQQVYMTSPEAEPSFPLETAGSCDAGGTGSCTGCVAPRSQKSWSRLRFPHLSRLWNK